MNSPRPMSPVFVSSIPEPRSPGLRKSTRRPKAPGACYPKTREEITRTTSTPSATSSNRRRSPEPGLSRGAQPPQSPASPGSPTLPIQERSHGSRIRRTQNSITAPVRSRNSVESVEATKTFNAIDQALRAVNTTIRKSKLGVGDCSPSPCASEDLESLCGTECTESTACSSSFSFSSSFSEGGILGETPRFTRISPSLKDARKTLKEAIGAEERSMRFARGLVAKLDDLRHAVAEDGSKRA